MADILVFTPQSQLTAEENLVSFINLCRNYLTAFGAEIDFDANTWNITASVQLKGKGKQQVNCSFSTLASCAQKSPTMMLEPFLSFAKADFRYSFSLRRSKTPQRRLSALRAVEAALSESGIAPNPVLVDAAIFNRAAQLLQERYRPSLAYRLGQELEGLASFMFSNHLVRVPLIWKNPIPRPTEGNRVGREFDERRAKKLPSAEAIAALPEIFRLATEPIDVLTSSVAAILCSAPDRVNEVLLLREDCEVRDKDQNGTPVYGLRWFPAKGADPMVKWIVPTMVSVVQEAIMRIRKISSAAREVAAWYEKNPHRLYIPQHLESLRGKELLTFSEVTELLFEVPVKGSGRQWCIANGVSIGDSGPSRRVRFKDVEAALIALLPEGFPWLNSEVGLKYSDALLTTRRYELERGRSTLNGVVDAITIQQISDSLGGRADHGRESLFSRLGFSAANGAPLKINTQQFRHYLNTLAQAGGMSQLDIAKWSGRRDIRQNEAYDHVTPQQILLKVRDAIGELPETTEALKQFPTRVGIRREEFLRLKVPTAHTTDYGYCIHDYTMSPCQLHMDCLHCEEQVCVKGDVQKTRLLKRGLEEGRKLLADARTAMDQGYKGSDRWMAHHLSTVGRLEQLAAILDDPAVPDGSVIQMTGVPSVSRIEQAEEARESGRAISRSVKGQRERLES